MKTNQLFNPKLDKYCKTLYFIYGKPSNLGRLSNYQLQSILDKINKYPQGLLNGYNKQHYKEAINYILDYRNGNLNMINELIEARRQQKAEQIANQLTNVIFKTFEKTQNKQLKLQLT